MNESADPLLFILVLLEKDDFRACMGAAISNNKDVALTLQVQAYLYDGYWEDIGTIEAFYNANLGITKKPVPDFR